MMKSRRSPVHLTLGTSPLIRLLTQSSLWKFFLKKGINQFMSTTLYKWCSWVSTKHFPIMKMHAVDKNTLFYIVINVIIETESHSPDKTISCLVEYLNASHFAACWSYFEEYPGTAVLLFLSQISASLYLVPDGIVQLFIIFFTIFLKIKNTFM